MGGGVVTLEQGMLRTVQINQSSRGFNPSTGPGGPFGRSRTRLAEEATRCEADPGSGRGI